MCRHIFIDGFGIMGDANVCCKCGFTLYEVPLYTRICCTFIENDGTYGNRNKFPFVVKFDKKIRCGTDFDNYPYAFNRRGKLVKREELGLEVNA